MKQPNRVQAAMRAGRTAHGCNLALPSPRVIDIRGRLDFDFVFIDGGHGPFGLDQLGDLCRTAERCNLTPIARVPDIDASTVCAISTAGSSASSDRALRPGRTKAGAGRAPDASGRDAGGRGSATCCAMRGAASWRRVGELPMPGRVIDLIPMRFAA